MCGGLGVFVLTSTRVYFIFFNLGHSTVCAQACYLQVCPSNYPQKFQKLYCSPSSKRSFLKNKITAPLCNFGKTNSTAGAGRRLLWFGSGKSPLQERGPGVCTHTHHAHLTSLTPLF